MTRLIIGSTAVKHWFPDFPREPKDMDLFTDVPEPGAECFWHPLFPLEFHPILTGYALPTELYTIKLSHSYWELPNGSWEKHIEDAMWLKAKGAYFDQPLHDLLYRVWEERYGRKQVDLTQESDEFFSDAVNRVYDHDSIHETVAYGPRPMYESVLKEGRSVQVDMEKVKALPFEDKVRLFREEIYATALERKVIPSGYTVSPRRAYAWALRRTITSLTKGWSATFIACNYDTFRRPDVDYVAAHLANKHKLIPLEEK